ncbi:muconate cycloisomerase family protein [Paraburkholderia silvatlantica]|uniref:muconate cycloisomerase family protein n=1 Tax=Paraburkholderia silvatlantica TaxID=321895 RepID=UPI0037518830
MKIDAIEALIVDVPTRRPIQMSITTVHRQSYVIVRVFAEGLVGVGEGGSVGGPVWSAECAETIKTIVERYLAPHLVGTDAFNVSAALQTMARAVTGNASAKAAVEMALLDLKARALDVSISELLGGKLRTSIPIAWTLASGDTKRDIDSAIELLEKRQHNRFKVKLGFRSPPEDLIYMEALSRELGSRASLRVDINMAWDEQVASVYIPELEALGVDLIEQPVARENTRALKRLSDNNRVAIMADESLSTLASAFDLARDRSVDVFSLKLCNMGGVTATQKVAAVAEASGIASYGGTMLDSTIGTSAALQLYSTVPSLPFGCELLGPFVLADTLSQEPLEIRDFELQVPTGAGHGMTLDEEKVRRYARVN